MLNLSLDESFKELIPLKNDLNLAPSAPATTIPLVVIGLLAASALTPAVTISPTVLAAWFVMLVALIDNWECPTIGEADEKDVVEVAAGIALLISECADGVEWFEPIIRFISLFKNQ